MVHAAQMTRHAVERTFDQLERSMLDEHTAVHPEKNPVARRSWSPDHLSTIITQYSFLSRHSVEFLTRCSFALAVHQWDALVAEVAENISEESGNHTIGSSHYDVFCTGAGEELGLDLAHAYPGRATTRFLDAWLGIPATRGCPEMAAGALFSFELSGVPEMRLVKQLISIFSAQRHGTPLRPGGTLDAFFNAHITTFEVRHADRIRRTVAQYLQHPLQLMDFSNGFHQLLHALDAWWEGLAAEAAQR